MTVAVTHRLSTLIAPPGEEFRDLVPQRPLQDQPRTETPHRLNRVLLADTGQHPIQF
jgi:hypothetical protein